MDINHIKPYKNQGNQRNHSINDYSHLKNKTIKVTFLSNNEAVGELISYDIIGNLIVKNSLYKGIKSSIAFYKGSNISNITPMSNYKKIENPYV